MRGRGRRREIEWGRERSIGERWQDQVFETRDVDGKRSNGGAKDGTKEIGVCVVRRKFPGGFEKKETKG